MTTPSVTWRLDYQVNVGHPRWVDLGWSFRRFWAATGLSNVSDGLFGVALSLAALQVTRNAVEISGLQVAAALPWLLFGLVAGAIADRVDRRRLMVGVQLTRAAVLAALALATVEGRPSIWLLYLVAVVMGVAETLFDTSAQSVLPRIVRADHLERANGRITGVELIGNFYLGPPLGGFIVAVAAGAAFATGSALYLVAAVAVLSVRGSFRVERSGGPTSVRQDIVQGLRFLRDQPLLRRLGLLTGARLVAFSAVTAVLPIYAVTPGPMGLSERGFGFFVAATANGAVLASFTGARVVARIGAARCLHLTMLAFAVTEVSLLLENPFAVGALWMVGTYFVIVWNLVTLTARQRLVPEQLLGRVNSAYRVVSWGSAPVGALLGGGLTELFGGQARVTFVLCAAATALLALGTLPVTDDGLQTGQLGPRPYVP